MLVFFVLDLFNTLTLVTFVNETLMISSNLQVHICIWYSKIRKWCNSSHTYIILELTIEGQKGEVRYLAQTMSFTFRSLTVCVCVCVCIYIQLAGEGVE